MTRVEKVQEILDQDYSLKELHPDYTFTAKTGVFNAPRVVVTTKTSGSKSLDIYAKFFDYGNYKDFAFDSESLRMIEKLQVILQENQSS